MFLSRYLPLRATPLLLLRLSLRGGTLTFVFAGADWPQSHPVQKRQQIDVGTLTIDRVRNESRDSDVPSRPPTDTHRLQQFLPLAGSSISASLCVAKRMLLLTYRSSRCKHSRLQASGPTARWLPELSFDCWRRGPQWKGNTTCCAGPSNTIAKARIAFVPTNPRPSLIPLGSSSSLQSEVDQALKIALSRTSFSDSELIESKNTTISASSKTGVREDSRTSLGGLARAAGLYSTTLRIIRESKSKRTAARCCLCVDLLPGC